MRRLPCLAALSSCFLFAASADSAPVDFVKDVRPILTAKCVRCHGAKKAEGGLRLDRKADALAGGNSGPAFEPGKGAASRLVRYVAGLDKDTVMPPSGPRLSNKQVDLLRAWIDQGAKWPDDATATTDRPGGDHWAFRPVRRPGVPVVKDTVWARNPIDHFILTRLEKEGIQPSPEADRATLLRRLSFDLLGLPPTVAEVEAFLADPRPDAYERLVDRLLASPHYGERWGRHWLDAARYADSDGYNFDAPRPIWKWRDWVIDALNRDLPFDQFTVEQIAGDLLPGATLNQKVATGFHRNTLFNAEGGNDPEEFRVERVVDRVSTTGAVFLGLTLGCAECHAHKYDPISQREFYELFAFFNSAEELSLQIPTAEEEAKRNAFRAELNRLQSELRAYDQAVKPAAVWGRRLLLSAHVPALGSLSFLPVVVNAHMEGDPVRQQLVNRIEKRKKQEPRVTVTLALAEPAKPRPTHIHVRGNFRRLGAPVTPNVPRVLPPLRVSPGAHAPGSPNRLDLARWLVSSENPLTARVTVNRIWQPYFGVGLVETENDFGKQGSPPTHPELLDWLASEFMTRGWGMKALHRLIVTSATYRQASNHRPDLTAVDPRNLLLGRQNRQRLEAEVVRDAMLATGGLLCGKIGGPSVFPYQPPGVMELRRTNIPWVVSPGPDRHRRGLYTHFWRTSPHPFLMTFDAPRSDAACTRRHRSNTPLQALMLLNDPTFVEAAGGLARRVLREGPPSDIDRLRFAFKLCMAREPNPTEHRHLNALLTQQLEEFTADPKAAQKLVGKEPVLGASVTQLAAWTALARVLFNLDEVITRE